MICVIVHAQTVRQLVGTVSALKPETAEIVIRPDKGDAITVKVSGSTIAQRIAPGARDLKTAASIKLDQVAPGDRVLVAIETGTVDLRRIVVMSATEIARRDEADRLDWNKRGVSGIFRERQGDAITLSIKGPDGEHTMLVPTRSATTFRRYGPDIVRFADAEKSAIGEIALGDQVLARGAKSPNGLDLIADDIVFGTFQTRIGSVVSVDAAAKRLTPKEHGAGKPLVANVFSDSQIKGMPDFVAMMGGTGSGGPPAGVRPQTEGSGGNAGRE